MVETHPGQDAPSEWAEYVKRAVKRCGGSVSSLRQKSGVSRSSLYRWMNDDGTRVTIEKARQIAEAIGDDPANAIRAAGALLDREDGADPRLEGLDPNDEVVAHIMSKTDITEHMRGLILKRHRENVERDRERYLAEIEFWANHASSQPDPDREHEPERE